MARRSSPEPDFLPNRNALIAVYPYKCEGLWVFDDEKVGVVQEPFISGADVSIDRKGAHIPGAARGFRLLFSAKPFPGCTAEFDWRREAAGGNWYDSRTPDQEGWLCPTLFRYVESVPKTIYAKFDAKDV